MRQIKPFACCAYYNINKCRMVSHLSTLPMNAYTERLQALLLRCRLLIERYPCALLCVAYIAAIYPPLYMPLYIPAYISPHAIPRPPFERPYISRPAITPTEQIFLCVHESILRKRFYIFINPRCFWKEKQWVWKSKIPLTTAFLKTATEKQMAGFIFLPIFCQLFFCRYGCRVQ